MARYNSSFASNIISGSTTIGSPYNGAFTNLTGTAPYTVTLPNPTLFPGSNQTFYNATGGTVTLSTPNGIFTGTGGSNAGTVLCYAGNVVSVTSDGTNYIVISEDGSALVATTGSFSGDVTINGSTATVSITPSNLALTPTATGNINNMNIGASSRGSGAFTSLAANSAVTFTANTSSTTTGTGTLVVTGGVGVSGQVTATSVSATNLTGTLQTASQTNVTAIGGNNAIRIDASGNVAINRASPVLKLHVVANTSGALALDLIDTTTTSSLMDASSTNNMIYLRTAFNSNPGAVSNAGAKWGIAFTGGPAGDNTNYPIVSNSSALGKSASIYAVSEDTGAGYNRQVGLSFWTSGFDLAQAERLRIRNDGFIGVATTTPAAKLTVKATDGATGGIRLAHSTDNGPVVNIYQSGSDGYIDLYTGENPTILRTHIAAYGDSYFNPANSGKVGIGTSGPSAKLHVVGSMIGGGTDNGAVILYGAAGNPLTIGSTDSVLSVVDRSNADWGITADKQGFDYGFRAQVSSSATYAYRVEGSGSETWRVSGSGYTLGRGFRSREAISGSVLYSISEHNAITGQGLSVPVQIAAGGTTEVYFNSHNNMSWPNGSRVRLWLVVNVQGSPDATYSAPLDITINAIGSATPYADGQKLNNWTVYGRDWGNNYQDHNISPMFYMGINNYGIYIKNKSATQYVEIFAYGFIAEPPDGYTSLD